MVTCNVLQEILGKNAMYQNTVEDGYCLYLKKKKNHICLYIQNVYRKKKEWIMLAASRNDLPK